MSRYDERMLKPSSNSLHFELIPRLLINTDNQIKLNPLYLKFQLFQGNRQCKLGEKLCSETKLIQVQVNEQGQIVINRAYLNFHTAVIEPKEEKYEIKLLRLLQNQTHILNELDNADSQKEVTAFGVCSVEIQNLVHDFSVNGIQHTCLTKEINSTTNLVFDLFIGKTRFTLEKYIRNFKSKSEQANINNILIDHEKQTKKQNMQPTKIRVSSPASHPRAKISKIEDKNFISPHKSLQKDRKLIVRVSKDAKKKVEVISEESSIMFSKQISKQDALKVDFRLSPRQISKSNELQLMPKSFEVQRQLTPQCGNMLQMPQDADLLSDIEAVRSTSEYKSDTKDSNKKKANTPSKSHNKIDNHKENHKQKHTQNNQAKQNIHVENVKSSRQGLTLKQKIGLTAFIIISFFILLQVMTPNKRV